MPILSTTPRDSQNREPQKRMCYFLKWLLLDGLGCPLFSETNTGVPTPLPFVKQLTTFCEAAISAHDRNRWCNQRTPGCVTHQVHTHQLCNPPTSNSWCYNHPYGPGTPAVIGILDDKSVVKMAMEWLLNG